MRIDIAREISVPGCIAEQTVRGKACAGFSWYCRESRSQEISSTRQVRYVYVMDQAGDEHAFHRDPHLAEDYFGIPGSLRQDDIVGFAMQKHNPRALAQLGRQRLRAEQRTGDGKDRARRGLPPETAEQDHHRPLAEPHQGIAVSRQAETGELGIDKPVEVGSGPADARVHDRRRAVGEAPPLAAGAGIMDEGRVRSGESGMRQALAKEGRNADQVRAVGADPVADNNQFCRRAPCSGPPAGSPKGFMELHRDLQLSEALCRS
jgi:hypothetical protein